MNNIEKILTYLIFVLTQWTQSTVDGYFITTIFIIFHTIIFIFGCCWVFTLCASMSCQSIGCSSVHSWSWWGAGPGRSCSPTIISNFYITFGAMLKPLHFPYKTIKYNLDLTLASFFDRFFPWFVTVNF